MKLLTHNFLSSRFLKNVNNGYPLILRANQKANKEVEFNEKFVLNMMPKVDYASLYNAALSIGEAGNMPESLPEDWETNVPVLMEVGLRVEYSAWSERMYFLSIHFIRRKGYETTQKGEKTLKNRFIRRIFSWAIM
ncbi:hypothetical protein Y032_0043g771 [Ancylostoma ceylanicum]|uniref:Uncharacterized protein n=1 Tax=Ancylostoma ceylanicum TaxID=53326 RepID=A0A016UE18_9BILA|nr:hypothetical protein Y032_0043g771 [Ancylostoma ceylanicum]